MFIIENTTKSGDFKCFVNWLFVDAGFARTLFSENFLFNAKTGVSARQMTGCNKTLQEDKEICIQQGRLQTQKPKKNSIFAKLV